MSTSGSYCSSTSVSTARRRSPTSYLLFAGIAIGDLSIERGARALVPFYAVLIAVLLLVTFVPALVMTLPRLLGA